MKKTALILMFITLLSKILGFAREIVMSYFYGASNTSDAYFISLTIPTVVFAFIGDGLNAGYIPLFSRIENEVGVEESGRFTNVLCTTLLIFSFFIVILLEIFTKQVVSLFAVGFSGEILNLAVNYTRITCFGIFFTIIISIYNSYLQMKNKFIVPSIFGFIYNFFVILSIYISYKTNNIFLVVGNVLALVVQFFLLLYFVMKNGLIIKFIIELKNKYMLKLIKLALPLIFGIAICQINVLVDKTLASKIAIGGVSALNYADRLNSFILSTVVMSISTVIFPLLSRMFSEKKINEFKKVLSSSVIIIALLLIPTTLGIILFSENIVQILFSRGNFDVYATKLTSDGLFFYSLGMLGVGLREIFTRAFYAIQETTIPVKNATFGILTNIVLNIFLSKYLGVGGLALATSISAIATTFLLANSLRKKIGSFGFKKIIIAFSKILLASIFMGIIALYSFNFFKTISSNNTALIISIIIGIVVYSMTVILFNIKDVNLVIKRLKEKYVIKK